MTEQLSPSQREALQQYVQVTNQEESEALPLLQRSQWNVQIAVAKFFDGEGPDLVAEAMAAQQQVPRPSGRLENLQESLMANATATPTSRPAARTRTDLAPRIVPQQPVTYRAPWPIRLLFAPFSWGVRAVSPVLRVLCFLLGSFLPASVRPRALGASRPGTGGRRMLLPRDTAARFKREFDEEYGQNELPFFEGGLAQAFDKAKKELGFLLLVLLSSEHDDTSFFIKETLLAPEVAAFLNNPSNNIVLWGGNVLDSEAYQAASDYNCTKFPFSALVCLTPKEGSTRMGVVKRLVGPMPAASYLSELQNAMEKYGADLEGVRSERRAQRAARELRTEQDSAYERSLAIDRERAREKREAAATAAEAEKVARYREAQAALLGEKRRQWRLWRAGRLLAEPAASDEVVRVALKLPDAYGGQRLVRRFPQDTPVEELYAYVECREVLAEHTGSRREEGEAPSNYRHEYAFRIASTLPRTVYEPSTTDRMGDKIGKSGNLIVEEVAGDGDGDGDGAVAESFFTLDTAVGELDDQGPQR